MSTPLKQNVTFPVGRLISGSVHEARTKDAKGKPLTTKDGKPRVEFAFGVAFEKKGTTVFWQTTWGAAIQQVARAAFPQMFDPAGTLKPGYSFSYKVTDGDSTAFNTAIPPRRPCDTPEWKDCWVVWFKSQFAPSTWNANGSAPVDPATIKCGHYVQVAGTIDSNQDSQKPGVYVNQNLVAHSGFGPEISRGPDPAAAGFGTDPAPAGMSSTPVGGLPGAGAATPSLPSAPVPPAAPPAPPPAITPHPAILQPPAGPQVTAAANGASWAQLLAAGWTEAVARQHGLIV